MAAALLIVGLAFIAGNIVGFLAASLLVAGGRDDEQIDRIVRESRELREQRGWSWMDGN